MNYLDKLYMDATLIEQIKNLAQSIEEQTKKLIKYHNLLKHITDNNPQPTLILKIIGHIDKESDEFSLELNEIRQLLGNKINDLFVQIKSAQRTLSEVLDSYIEDE